MLDVDEEIQEQGGVGKQSCAMTDVGMWDVELDPEKQVCNSEITGWDGTEDGKRRRCSGPIHVPKLGTQEDAPSKKARGLDGLHDRGW